MPLDHEIYDSLYSGDYLLLEAELSGFLCAGSYGARGSDLSRSRSKGSLFQRVPGRSAGQRAEGERTREIEETQEHTQWGSVMQLKMDDRALHLCVIL